MLLTKTSQNSTTVFASYFAFPHNFYEMKPPLLTSASRSMSCLFFCDNGLQQ